MPDDHHDASLNPSSSDHSSENEERSLSDGGASGGASEAEAEGSEVREPAPPPMLGEKPIPGSGMPRPSRRNIKHHEGSIKETIISMMISLAMALVAKAYVIEAFVIPTGSMAPTLLGKHMLFDSRQTGYEWTVNPWFEDSNRNPFTIQEYQGQLPVVTDPMTVSCVEFDSQQLHNSPDLRYDQGFTPAPVSKRILPGDRILVHKYLYEIFPPQRYDVVVFKNPEDATINFIKRLIGLPNEEIWLADGDVFARPCTIGDDGSKKLGGWQIQRKPARVQRSVWRTVYSSEYEPLEPVSATTGRRWFTGPWSGRGWETEDRRIYRTNTSDLTDLRWDLQRWPITDWEPYNDVRMTTRGRLGGQQMQYPVSDVRLRAIVTPDTDDLRLLGTIRARGQMYQCEIKNGLAVVRMRDGNGPWQELSPPKIIRPFKAGTPRAIEFWHVDQTLQIWIDEEKVVEGFYDWDPGIRLFHSTGKDGRAYGPKDNSLGYPRTYDNAKPTLVEWTFEGSPVTLARVGLDRDLYYQPRNYANFSGSDGPPAFGTHPSNLVTLDSDEFFMLGDNSPSSADGRLWETIDPNVAAQIDDKKGVVNQKLLLGKAFFVYFPAPHTLDLAGFHIPIPDFGNMRFIK